MVLIQIENGIVQGVKLGILVPYFPAVIRIEYHLGERRARIAGKLFIFADIGFRIVQLAVQTVQAIINGRQVGVIRETLKNGIVGVDSLLFIFQYIAVKVGNIKISIKQVFLSSWD